MAWNAINDPTDLETVLAAPELAAYRAAALAAGEPDPVAAQVTNCVNMMRGYIAAWSANTLGPEGTIPDKLLFVALDILAVTIPRRCAGSNPTESRERAYSAAIKILEAVARGAFKLEVPASYTTEQIAVPAPSIGRPSRCHREFGRDAERGS